MIWLIPAFLIAASLTVALWLRSFSAPKWKAAKELGRVETLSFPSSQGGASIGCPPGSKR